MTSENWERIKDVFALALEKEPGERRSFLAGACKGDHALSHEVNRLLLEYEKAGEFLDSQVNLLGYSLINQLGCSLSPGELVGGRYRVLHLIGRGGMGEVHEVRDELLDQCVALKTLRPEFCYDESFLRRFRNETQLARKVTHPNVCRLFEAGIHKFPQDSRPPIPFFAMELLPGETLSARIRRLGKIPKQDAFPLIVQMAEGLQAAHTRGIIHRDFKSANVIVNEDQAVITDFGLAKLDSPPSVVSTRSPVMGTIAYMAPEQMRGGRATAASDIYSLGVVLFEMAAGQLPYDDRHFVHSGMQRAQGQTASVRALCADIDSKWEFAINRCLEPDPAKRFSRASEVASLFREGEWRLPRVYWSRRKWAGVTALAALPLAAGGSYAMWSRRPYAPKAEALIWHERGVEAFRASIYESARRNLEKAVEMDPRYAPSHAYLSAAYSDLDSSERAKEEILKAISVAQDERLSEVDIVRVKALQYVISRDFNRAKLLLDQLKSTVAEVDRAGTLIEIAWLAEKREDDPGMIPALTEALRLNPSHAGAKLRMALALERHGRKDAAQIMFREAEALFHAASDYNGVVETLLQWAIALARSNRNDEAITHIERGMRVATSTGDLYHRIQLHLAAALAYRNVSQVARSREEAESAVKMAVENKMDGTAAMGLLDLGNAYMLLDEPEHAERSFKQGLELAGRARALSSQARAGLSLASLCVQYNRAAEASTYVPAALAFFREAGHKRESMQALLILGGAEESLARLDAAERTLLDAIELGQQIRDAENTGLARSYLGLVLEKGGRWPESIAEKNSALEMLGDVRGGLRRAYVLADRGNLFVQMNRLVDAAKDFTEVRQRLEKLEGPLSQLRARLAIGEAHLARYQARHRDSLGLARHAATLRAGTDDDIEAGMLSGLAMIGMGSAAEGISTCGLAIQKSASNSRPYLKAWGELALAQLLWQSNIIGNVPELAASALGFFEQRKVWESLWRCHKLLTPTGSSNRYHADAALACLDQMKKRWPVEAFQVYLRRPDVQRLLLV